MKALIALGGNQGDVVSTASSALSELHRISGVEVLRVSAWHSTEPVGCEGRFLNAAAVLNTMLAPLDLLDRLLEVELQHGRVRAGHWAPRTLDLDLVLYGDQTVDCPRLIVPHPFTWMRRFVLDPAAEIAGDWIHPVSQCSLRQMLDRLDVRPLPIGVDIDESLWRRIWSQLPLALRSQVLVVPAATWGMTDVAATFVADARHHRPFTVLVPADVTKATPVVMDTLTAMLDRPMVVDTASS